MTTIIDDVREDVEDALADRFTREIYVHDKGEAIICEMGGQYNELTVRKIAEEDVEPAIPEDWELKTAPAGIFSNETCQIQIDCPDLAERNRKTREMMAQGLSEMLSTDGGNEDDE